jgi:hypothetical protein
MMVPWRDIEWKVMDSKKRYVVFVAVFCLTAGSMASDANDLSDFASELVDYRGPFGVSPYDDPCSVLGKPTTWIYDDWDELTYACSLVFPAYLTDPNGNKVVTTINEGAEIVVKFDHKVADDPGNRYGTDFIVFGNSAFATEGWVEHETDMAECYLRSSASINVEPALISVAQETDGPWFTFANGPYGDTAFPTNAFAWDRDANDWGEEQDWLKPVGPNLSLADFDGLTAADAIDLYGGSAGGTGFDLQDLAPEDYAALAEDANSGRKWIQYIKVEYLPGASYAGEIDGFADAAGCGDYKNPHPVGDIDRNCSVDYVDLAVVCGYWLRVITEPNRPAAAADVYEDGIVNLRDFAIVAGNWSVTNRPGE